MRLTIVLLLLVGLSANAQEREELGSAINTEYNEIHPVISPDGETLFFVREGHPSNNFAKEGGIDVWYSSFRSDGRWTIARKMPNTINKGKYNALLSITPDGSTILIRGVYQNGRKLPEVGLSVCKKTNRGWGQPSKLDIPKLDAMCKGEFLSAYLTNSGKVLLLSFAEKKHSRDNDIFVSFLGRDGKWSKPESLGSDINTSAIEATPFMASDDYTLYFCSDRKGGEGGIDIWASKRLNRNWTKWSKPLNLGKKFNTDKDDMYFSITANGEYAYVNTKSNTAGKGDIVRYRLRDDSNDNNNVAALQGAQGDDADGKDGNDEEQATILKELTSPKPVVMISGKVIDTKTKKPIEAKIIYESFPDGEEIGVAQTDPSTGEYKIILPYGKRYSVRAEANDFIAIGETIDLSQEGTFKEIKNEDLEMAPIAAGISVTLKNIFFEFAKATLEEESFPELDRLIRTMTENPNMTIEVQGHTDNVGPAESNLKLSEQRAESVRNYLLGKGIKAERVSSVGFGETKPVASNETTEGQAQNRRVEFVIMKK
ncbi:OmpA family protein [Marinilongibacter aquaticus]|uniref:OmpA family protein n=1 Tax=Marinilongibacter aquaticus TaxID=2975157 RepID=UPI0021BDEBB5|nr:OmpA family protein [Marinilongibacter aquaticus]UBM60714.1 OmpA family protein [Marinilongibacter aquaticus]